MVINLKDIPQDIMGIPDAWMYHYYLNLREPLDGRRIRLKSPFTSDSNPSMYLYVRGGKYRWKDFSSGEVGSNPISLIKNIFTHSAGYEVSFRDTVNNIRSDYNTWILKYGTFIPELLETTFYAYTLGCNYRIADMQSWDYMYWSSFNVDKKLLERFNVYPLTSFQLYKEINDGDKIMYPKKSFRFSYGVFSNSAQLIKIYNPFYEDLKHVNLISDILGREQLNHNSNTLLILSGLKDMLCAASLGLEIDVCAPMSEKALIPNSDMDKLKEIYIYILTLFDNDPTGIRAMMKYQQIYNVDYVYLPYKKDLAETYNYFRDTEWLKHDLAQKINKKINELA